mmetsp:Transcript_25539/g.37720  ORF Transcript_25539/g.37720 Transcript_25539/m.37720 type:complete len:1330 (-) Transcript_25539:240-4229(-)|eukprot:CAMPEP_0185040048 /NCGR_PEP_ID=MMETSP1103-20130426/37654_1 /TAXON_ID=36769 /ORGANISM="Paraphysomonas bandaiensis, Strain Caron Lab Isolate" /LENGTH=1329 /DNA_ID=CAMNT_0027579185 /DNA_START=218 /DNA_END=4207 /DNA_ORIENTATION=+
MSGRSPKEFRLSADGEENDPARHSSVGMNRPTWANPIGGLSEEEYEDRRRSLDCSALKVSIPSVATATKKPGDTPFTVYVIQVVSGASQWVNRRRYSDFYYVHHLIKKYVKDEDLPQLPPKRYFGSSTDARFVEERRGQLEVYLRKLILDPHVWARGDLVQFLDNENNTLMFMWNLERMRKMQNMLGNMTVENKNQTEKLSAELENAKSEVRVLRDRIAQMEMFFMQHATGVASTKLTPTAMRSLSGGSGTNLKDMLQAIEERDESEEGSREETEEQEYDGGIFIEGSPQMPETEGGDAYGPEEVLEILKMTRGSDISAFDDMSIGDFSNSTANNSALSAQNATRSQAKEVEDSIQQRMVNMSKQLQDAVKLSNELLEEKLQLLPRMGPASVSSAGDSIAGTGRAVQAPYLEQLSSDQSLDDSPLLDVLPLYPGTGSGAHAVAVEGDETPSTKERLPWVDKLFGRFAEVMVSLVPSQESVNERLMVLHYIRTVIARSLGAQVFPVGSFTSRSFLPGGDLDITAFLTADQTDSWFVRVNEAMCISSMGDGPGGSYAMNDGTYRRISVRNVSFINAWVKVVKGIVNGIEVDISANQIGALYAQALVDKIDEYIGQKHLFKRSALLVKAWCKYESPRHTAVDGGAFGAREGRLSTWTIVVMVIWIFNKCGRQITDPFQALVGFLAYFSGFEWGRYALTVHGPVSVEDLSPVKDLNEFYALPLCGGFIPAEVLDSYRDRFAKTKEASLQRRREKLVAQAQSQHTDESETSGVAKAPSMEEVDSRSMEDLAEELRVQTGIVSYNYYKRGIINVMDPVQPKNNCSRAVDMAGFRAITEAFQMGKVALIKLCMACRDDDHAGCDSIDAPSKPVCDVSVVRSFMEGTMSRIQETKLGGGPPVTIAGLEQAGYPTLDVSRAEMELAMKHAELILGAIITPESLARMIVYIIEIKGPQPVGEIGKLLQELTGNENLSMTLKANFKGLKKVIEGFGMLFTLGGDHPFNPFVHLSETYINRRNECWYDDSGLSDLYVFDSTVASHSNKNRTTPNSPASSGQSSQDPPFVPLVKGMKAHSFREGQGHAHIDRGDVKRSGSLSSAPTGLGIASGLSVVTGGKGGITQGSPGGQTRGKGKGKNSGGKSPSNQSQQFPPRHSKQHHQHQQFLQQQFFQQQQYQQHMQYQNLQYQQYLQHLQQQQQVVPGTGGVQVLEDRSGSAPPPLPPGYGPYVAGLQHQQQYPVMFAPPVQAGSPDAMGGGPPGYYPWPPQHMQQHSGGSGPEGTMTPPAPMMVHPELQQQYGGMYYSASAQSSTHPQSTQQEAATQKVDGSQQQSEGEPAES